MKYKSCHLIEHGISIDIDSVQACCLSREFNKGLLPVLNFYGNNKINWDELFRVKREQRKAQQIKDLAQCEGCYSLYEQDWDDDDYIAYINFNHWSECNSRCIYCGVNLNRPRTKNNILPAIKDLIKSGKFRDYGEITFQGGEPTIMKEFEQLLNLFIPTKTAIRIHSSGILFSRAVREGLKKGRVSIIISPDSATKEVYEKIKRVDKSDTVWGNIAHYRKNLPEIYQKMVKVKYIIIPGVNDTLDEVDAYLRKIKELDIRSIIVDVEYSYANNNLKEISPHVYMLMDYFENYAQSNNLEFEWYDSAKYVSMARTFPHQNGLDRELFEKYKSENTDKNYKYYFQ
ncbi:radical SAM protein [bacterium]|nr:radical SAM protein [bacterium]